MAALHPLSFFFEHVMRKLLRYRFSLKIPSVRFSIFYFLENHEVGRPYSTYTYRIISIVCYPKHDQLKLISSNEDSSLRKKSPLRRYKDRELQHFLQNFLFSKNIFFVWKVQFYTTKYFISIRRETKLGIFPNRFES